MGRVDSSGQGMKEFTKKDPHPEVPYVVAFLNPSIRCNEFLLSRSVSICQWQVVYPPPTHTEMDT